MQTKLMIITDTDTTTTTNYFPYTTMQYSGANSGSQNSSMSSFGNEMNFEVSDFLEFSNWIEDVPLFSSPPDAGYGYNMQNPVYTNNETFVDMTIGSGSNERDTTNRGMNGREKKQIRDKVAFKTKSEVEILDDGFKWRKYGKKMVKNRKNPRNYYKCSVEGCPVKKRVERDNDDARYVLTTYEGIHNHQGPMQ